MYNPITFADNFYQRRVSTVPDVYKTCGNIFLIYGAFAFASVFPFGFIMAYSAFGIHFWFSVVRAGSIATFSVFAGILMHFETIRSIRDAVELEDAQKRAGQCLIVLSFIIFLPFVIPIVCNLFPFPPFTYLRVFLSDGIANIFNFLLTAKHIESWPLFFRICGFLCILLGTLLYCIYCLGVLVFAIRLLIDGYSSINSNGSAGLMSRFLIGIRELIGQNFAPLLRTEQGVYRASGYIYLGIVAVMALPVMVYQITMLVLLGKNTLLADIWLSIGRNMSGTTVLILLSTVLLFLICTLFPLFGSWKAFRNSRMEDSSDSNIAVLSRESKWLKRTSFTLFMLAILFSDSASTNFLTSRRSRNQRPNPILLFAQSHSPNSSPSKLYRSHPIRRSEVTVFLWLQCFPMFGMSALCWSVSRMMNKASKSEENKNTYNSEKTHRKPQLQDRKTSNSSNNLLLKRKTRMIILVFLITGISIPTFIAFSRTWNTIKYLQNDQVICDVTIYRTKELRLELTDYDMQKCINLLQDKEVVQSVFKSKVVSDLPLFKDIKDPAEWIVEHLTTEELGERGSILRLNLKILKGCVDQGIILLDEIANTFISAVQKTIPGSVAIQDTHSRNRFGRAF